MSINPYFNFYNHTSTQDLYEGLVIESIKIYGHEVLYIPRELVNFDFLFGEEEFSKFSEAIPMELYIQDVNGFVGQGDFMSKFGLQIADEISFTISRKRFDQAITSPKLQLENGFNLVLEEADLSQPSRQYLSGTFNGKKQADQSTSSIMLEHEGYQSKLNRPREGDLIWFPLVRKPFEIKFVEHEQMFYQLGRLNTYELRCQLFEYSSEEFTGTHSLLDGTIDMETDNPVGNSDRDDPYEHDDPVYEEGDEGDRSVSLEDEFSLDEIFFGGERSR